MKPHLKKLLVVAAVLAGVGCFSAGGDCDEPKKPQGPFGEPVRGAKLGLRAPTWLRVGQPFEVQPPAVVFARFPLPPGTKSLPDINILSNHELPRYSLELTDANGRMVSFRIEQPGQHEWPALSTLTPLRLWPTETHARGRYWKPGVYHLRAYYEESRNPMRPYHWYGKLVSNSVRLEIVEPDTPVPSPFRDAKVRKRIDEAIKNLDSPELTKRQASQEALEELGIVVLSQVDAALLKASGIARKRLEQVLRRITLPYAERLVLELPEPLGPFLAGLDDETWNTLKKHLGEPSQWFTNKPPKDWYGVRRAHYAPVLTLSDKELLRMLGHPQPEMRIRALRSFRRTDDLATLEKLVACLDDSYFEYLDQWGSVAFPVAQDAEETIVHQGQKMVALLLELVKKKRPQPPELGPPREPYLREIIEILGKIGPSEQSARFLDEMMRHEKYDYRFQAIKALMHWGRAGVPMLLKIAQDDKAHHVLRRMALEHFGRFGKPEDVGECLRSMLHPSVPDELAGAAIDSIRNLKLKDAIPHVKSIALTEQVRLRARDKAIEALVLLADRQEVSKVLLALVEANGRGIPFLAVYYLGYTRNRAAVARLLHVLEHEQARYRETADLALRAIADLPEGVGYDSTRRDCEPWRKWWQSKK